MLKQIQSLYVSCKRIDRFRISKFIYFAEVILYFLLPGSPHSILCSRCNLGHKMIEYASCCIRPTEVPGASGTGGIEYRWETCK